MPKKKGPPYTDTPECKYVLIIDPWGMLPAGRRTQDDINRLGVWIRFMLRAQRRGPGVENDLLVEAVYTRNTQNEVIVQLPEGTDIGPILGQHRWADFLTHTKGPNGQHTASYILEYNYRASGEPGNHNWDDKYPTSDLPPPGHLAIKDPYPLRPHFIDIASWPRLISFGLILPLPKDWKQIPTPPRTPPPPQNLFTPYEPPVQRPAHAALYADIKTESSSDIPRSMDKFDPYDQEEAALQLLRKPAPSATTSRPVKQENTEYHPSLALVDSIAQHRSSQSRQESVVKSEPESGSSTYRASQALVDSMASRPQQTTRQDHVVKSEPEPNPDLCQNPVVKSEPGSDPATYRPSAALVETMASLPSHYQTPNRDFSVQVKTEPRAETEDEPTASQLVAQAIQELRAARMPTFLPATPQARVKEESSHDGVPRDSRRRSHPQALTSIYPGTPKRPKEEEKDHHGRGVAKRVKVEY